MKNLGGRSAMALGFVSAMAISTPALVAMAYYAAPGLQARVIPILDVQLLKAEREGDTGVWTIRMHKRYSAKLLSVDYYVRTSTNQRIPIKAFRCTPDATEISSALPEHEAGQTWTTMYCTIITPDIDGTKGVEIEGVSTYRSWPYMWDVSQPTVHFLLPPASAQ